MDYATGKHISVGVAQVEAGLTENGWRRFLASTGLKTYRIPGGGRVVDRKEFDDAVVAVREEILRGRSL